MPESSLAQWKALVLRRLYDRNGRTVDLARSPTAGWVALKCRRVAASGDARRALETLGRMQPITRSGPFVPLLEFGFDGETNTVWEILRAVDDVGGGPVSDRSDYTPATAVERLTNGKPLSLEEVLVIGTRITGALDSLHRIGLFHHDVKTSNLFVLGGELCLGDYDGVSSGTGPAVSEGTEGYVPLEGVVRSRADFYGLGKTLYELWTGLSRLEFPSIPPGLLRADEWRTGGRRFNALLLQCCSDDGTRAITEASQMLRFLEDVRNPETAGRSWFSRHLWLVLPAAALLPALLLVFASNRGRGLDAKFLTNGLVLHLPLDGDARDLSGRGNHGVIHGPVPAMDRFGNPRGAYRWDSPTQFITTVRGEMPLRSMTLSVWLKSGSEGPLLVFCGSGDAGNYDSASLNLGLVQNADSLAFTVFRGGEHFAVSKAPTADELWHHVAATLSSAGARLYRDGRLVTSDPVNQADGSQPAWWRLGRIFTGSLDDFRVYDRALSTEEVAALHQREAVPPSEAFATNGLSAHFPLNGDAVDQSGFGRTTLVSNVTATANRFGRADQAAYFNGSNSVVVVTESAGLGLAADFSLSLWFRPDSTRMPQVIVGTTVHEDHTRGWRPNTNGWHLSLQEVPSKSVVFSAAPFFNIGSPSVAGPELRTWHHLAFTYSRPSGIWRFHLNGTLGATGMQQWTADEGKNPFTMGAQAHEVLRPFAYHFQGALDDLRLYRRALSPDEIQALYSGIAEE